MFDTVAPSYDRFTRVFSLGMDARWKRALVERVASEVGDGATVLDLATGTGDLAGVCRLVLPRATVVGLDVSRGMLQRHARRGSARLSVGDMMRLPVRSACADVVLAAYAFRNLPDWRAALDEVRRVLRPGGLLATLDFYRPTGALWRRVFVSYLRVAGGVAGWWWHGLPAAYSYLGPSVDGWISLDEYARGVADAGFTVEMAIPHLAGAIGLHVARRLPSTVNG